MLHDLEHVSTLITHYAELYGALAIFVMIYFESFGAPLPAESAMVAGTVLASKGELQISHVVAGAIAGAILGDTTGYLIGRFGGRALIAKWGPKVGLTEKRFSRFEAEFEKRGIYAVIFARFLFGLRQLNGIIAGSAGMAWPRFLLANAVGAILWVGLWTGGARLLGAAL
jgi:membrane protein DedA with SNARE-associated domain